MPKIAQKRQTPLKTAWKNKNQQRCEKLAQAACPLASPFSICVHRLNWKLSGNSMFGLICRGYRYVKTVGVIIKHVIWHVKYASQAKSCYIFQTRIRMSRSILLRKMKSNYGLCAKSTDFKVWNSSQCLYDYQLRSRIARSSLSQEVWNNSYLHTRCSEHKVKKI